MTIPFNFVGPEVTSGLTDPGVGFANLVVTCIDNEGNAEADVVVEARLIEVPSGESGRGYDGSKRSATSDANGFATFTKVVRGARYQIRRGESKLWTDVTIADEETTTVSSFIGL